MFSKLVNILTISVRASDAYKAKCFLSLLNPLLKFSLLIKRWWSAQSQHAPKFSCVLLKLWPMSLKVSKLFHDHAISVVGSRAPDDPPGCCLLACWLRYEEGSLWPVEGEPASAREGEGELGIITGMRLLHRL